MALCMHLLRLRPTVEQLRSWNHELNEPYQMLEECGWTAFLRRLTPPSTLEGLGAKYESADKLEKRQKALNDLYDIAEKEEQYIRGEYGGCLITLQIAWQVSTD